MSMFPDAQTRRVSLEYSGERDLTRFNFFNAVYAWMCVGLGVTAAVAFGVSRSPALLHGIFSSGFSIVAILLAAYLVAAAAQNVAMRVGAAAGLAMFLLYAAIIGAAISYVFLLYPMATLGGAFLMTAGTFGAMSVIGFVTKRDLTTIGSYLIMAVVGLVIASVVNIFLQSNGLSWILSYAILAVFIGLTAYHTQQLKQIADRTADDANLASRYAVVGSMLLYAAFINMFLSILRIMGGNGRR